MEKDILKEIEEYVNSSSAYLSQSNEYSRGYKDGVIRVKDIIKEIIENHRKNND